MNYLFCDTRRHVIDANYMTYTVPCLHPDRIMDIHDLIYMIEGEWEIIQDGIKYILRQGDVLFLFAGHHHYGVQKCTPGTRTMFVHFNAHPNDLFGENKLGFLPIRTVSNYRKNDAVRRSFERLITTYWSTRNEKDFRLSALIDLMLSEVSADASAYKSQTSQLVLEIQKIIHTRSFQKNIAEVLSEQMNMSIRSLRYYFKKEMGISLSQYQLKTKLEMSFQQLQIDNQQTILGIALNFGFYDEFHFSHQFKKHFGIPPSQVTKLFNTKSIASTNDGEL